MTNQTQPNDPIEALRDLAKAYREATGLEGAHDPALRRAEQLLEHLVTEAHIFHGLDNLLTEGESVVYMHLRAQFFHQAKYLVIKL
jgi:hypothetical protein